MQFLQSRFFYLSYSDMNICLKCEILSRPFEISGSLTKLGRCFKRRLLRNDRRCAGYENKPHTVLFSSGFSIIKNAEAARHCFGAYSIGFGLFVPFFGVLRRAAGLLHSSFIITALFLPQSARSAPGSYLPDPHNYRSVRCAPAEWACPSYAER